MEEVLRGRVRLSGLGRRSSWRLLFDLVRPHKRVLLLGGVFTLVGSFAGLAMPILAKGVIDTFGKGGDLVGPVLGLSVAVLVAALILAVGRFLLERMGEGIVLASRMSLVDRILRLKVADVDRLKPGDLLSRVSSDTTLLRAVCTEALASSVNAIFMFLGAVVLMAIIDGLLLMVTLVVVALISLIAASIVPRIGRASLQAQVALGEMSSVLDRALQAFRTVKASGAESREIAVVGAAAAEARDRGVAAAAWTSVTSVGTWMSTQLAFLAVLGVGGARVADGSMEISSLVAFLLYLFYLVSPIGTLIQNLTQMQNGLAAITRIQEISKLPSEPPTPETREPETGDPVGLVFSGVVFRYGEDRPIIHNQVNFEVPAGGMTALVGPSGAGKSTVFGLIERFYEPQAGTILIGGRDIREWPLGELRASLGYVEQDAPVLAGTFRENLVFGAPGATEEEIAYALTRTRLDDLVARLPEGLNTPVGHRGVLLSGGERQRVAIARALLRRPRLLLLDEATSQLDAVNELRLREVVAEVARETTVLVIAHRLSTVTGANRIILMEAGRVRAYGTHDELVDADDLYRELAATQFLVTS
ncbi:ABC transporter ATP-binding protein/permease [Streptosporangium sp. NBC_01755]|uniref:ABC transporter ATP-binding protein n=1 Tax=unclassified Streptosporangium TaxID=2632669 RepID=UPI002DDA8A5F|nr:MULTISPECIES: ABC transporter ATP-binding protein [unclassified Streptosporangium]WSA29360.1 ABC transporter ATP-binding protein/permease [Streptosporangium sp. NBC_01810]WSC99197.1 ABC transporter ATP-binding protein/permease [Streptosporangium sp. NBC_01755]